MPAAALPAPAQIAQPQLIRASSQKISSPLSTHQNLMEDCSQMGDGKNFCISCSGGQIIKLVFDGKLYKVIEGEKGILGSGSFGLVQKWVKISNINEDQLAIKYIEYYQDDDDDYYNDFEAESNVSKFLTQLIQKNPDIDFSVIPSYVPDNNICNDLSISIPGVTTEPYLSNGIIILHLKNGDLESFRKEFYIRQLRQPKLDQMKKISKHIYQSAITSILNLFKKDIFYSDLKPKNLLYSYPDIANISTTDSLEKLKIYLGDIGGIFFAKQFYEANQFKVDPNLNNRALFTYCYVTNNNISKQENKNLDINNIYANTDNSKFFILNFIHQIFYFRYFCLISNLAYNFTICKNYNWKKRSFSIITEHKKDLKKPLNLKIKKHLNLSTFLIYLFRIFKILRSYNSVINLK